MMAPHSPLAYFYVTFGFGLWLFVAYNLVQVLISGSMPRRDGLDQITPTDKPFAYWYIIGINSIGLTLLSVGLVELVRAYVM